MSIGSLSYAARRANASIDAFARSRVSAPQTLFDSKQLFDNQPLHWDDAEISGGGTSSTHSPALAATTMAVSLNTAGVRIRQSRRHMNYQPGKSQLIFLTGVLGAGVAGIRRRIGYFDTADGLFFQLSGTTLSVVRRTSTSGSPVDTVYPQSTWNLDRMDGTGPSGKTLDTSKAQIMVIDFEWLGVGDVRFGFVFDGTIFYTHVLENPNLITTVYMSTPNLPVRYEIENLGTGPVASLVQICCSVMSEGGFQELGFPFALDRAAFVTLNDADMYPLIALRFRSGRYNEAAIRLSSISLVCTSTAAYRWSVRINPTVAGTALSFTGVTNSALEAATAQTNATKVSGGTVILSGVSQSTNESVVNVLSPADYFLGSKIDGTSDVLVLCIERLTGNAETFYSSLAWRELV